MTLCLQAGAYTTELTKSLATSGNFNLAVRFGFCAVIGKISPAWLCLRPGHCSRAGGAGIFFRAANVVVGLICSILDLKSVFHYQLRDWGGK